MSGKESKKKKVPEVLSWQQKKERADIDEEAIKKDVEELVSWTTMIKAMNDEQMKEYLLSRPKHAQSAKTGKIAPLKKARRGGKPRSSAASLGIMASVWKFHKDDDEAAAAAAAAVPAAAEDSGPMP